MDLFYFLRDVLANPNILLNANLRNKNRAQKITEVFTMIKILPKMDNSIVIRGIHDVRPFIRFDRLAFQRSFDYISHFAVSSSANKHMAAMVVGRKVQVYDYISARLLFELNLPNAATRHSVGIQFLDNDNILMV